MARKTSQILPPPLSSSSKPTPRPPTGVTRSWQSIDQFPRASYTVDIEWPYLEGHIERQIESGLDLDPDYQRSHVWTTEQRVAWLEYVLMGGEVGRRIIMVCTDWHAFPVPGYSILDGKQRLETVRLFMGGKIRIFGDNSRPDGYLFEDFTGAFRGLNYSLQWQVTECKTRADVLRLYLMINTGGTPHSPEEIARVRALLDEEIRCGRG